MTAGGRSRRPTSSGGCDRGSRLPRDTPNAVSASAHPAGVIRVSEGPEGWQTAGAVAGVHGSGAGYGATRCDRVQHDRRGHETPDKDHRHPRVHHAEAGETPKACAVRQPREAIGGEMTETAALKCLMTRPVEGQEASVCAYLDEADGTPPVDEGERAAWFTPEAAASLSMACGADTLFSPAIVASAKATRTPQSPLNQPVQYNGQAARAGFAQRYVPVHGENPTEQVCGLSQPLVPRKRGDARGGVDVGGAPQGNRRTDADPDGSMTPCATRLFASTNMRWMGRRSGATSAWPGIGSIHPAWVGDDEPLDVRPVRSIAAKETGFSKPCVESWVTRSATS
jgi:hypothetical protein